MKKFPGDIIILQMCTINKDHRVKYHILQMCTINKDHRVKYHILQMCTINKDHIGFLKYKARRKKLFVIFG